MIVTCEGCKTRFHLADAQVPPQGARVRCSKCHHRFLVKPSEAEPEAEPAPRPAAQTSPIPARPQSEAAPDEPDLDNPQFLFDGEDAALSVAFGGKTMPLGDETREVGSSEREQAAAIQQPAGAAREPDGMNAGVEEAALGLRGSSSAAEIGADGAGLALPDGFLGPDGDEEDELFGDSEVPTGKNLGGVEVDAKAQDGGAGQAAVQHFEIGSGDAVDASAGELTDENPLAVSPFEEMDRLDQPFTLAGSGSAQSPLHGSDPESMDPMDLLGGDGPDPLSPEDQPGPEGNPLAGPELDTEDLLSGVLDEEDDGDPMGSWDPLAGTEAPARPAPQPLRSPLPAALTRSVESEPPAPVRLEVPPPPSDTDVELVGGRLTERVLRIAAVAAGLFLLVAGASAMATHGLGHEPGPETLYGAGWVATEIEALQLRDASERRVLVLRGLLLPQSGGPPPLITARLLDDKGVAVSPPHIGVAVRLANPELSPQALSAALAAGAPRPVPDANGTEGFTVLIPDPAPEARRFEIELLGVQPGTASRADS